MIRNASKVIKCS